MQNITLNTSSVQNNSNESGISDNGLYPEANSLNSNGENVKPYIAYINQNNTFTTTQRIGNLIIDAGIPPTSTTLSTIGSDSSGNMYFTIGSGMNVYWYNSGNNFMTMGEFGIETLNMQNGIINGLNTINPNPNVTASMNWGGQVSNTPNTTHNSSVINILGTYNNGLGSLEYGIQQQFIQDTFTPTGHLQFSLNNSGTLTSIAELDETGNLTTNGYATKATASNSVSVGTSPYTYTNASVNNQEIFIQGGTVSAITFNPNNVVGITLSSLTDNIMIMRPNDSVTITYTVAPTITTIQM